MKNIYEYDVHLQKVVVTSVIKTTTATNVATAGRILINLFAFSAMLFDRSVNAIHVKCCNAVDKEFYKHTRIPTLIILLSLI